MQFSRYELTGAGEMKDHLPQPDGDASPTAAQDAPVLLCLVLRLFQQTVPKAVLKVR